jgi:hypothetical protein
MWLGQGHKEQIHNFREEITWFSLGSGIGWCVNLLPEYIGKLQKLILK